jgi:hypothetical protein
MSAPFRDFAECASHVFAQPSGGGILRVEDFWEQGSETGAHEAFVHREPRVLTPVEIPFMKATFIASGAAALGLASAASADITISLTNSTFAGFQFNTFLDYTQFNVVGTLTAASINVTLNSSVAYTYADDLCVYVDIEPLGAGSSNVGASRLQIGGFSNLGAPQRLTWPNGASSAPGTTSIGTRNLTTALTFTGDKAVDGTIWIGNGYGAAGTAGTWTGTVTLIGLDVVPIPAPGALALLGVAGLVGRRRRGA